MRRHSAHVLTLAGLITLGFVAPAAHAQQDLANAPPGRAMNQPIDSEYTKKIKEYTTESFFLSPLVDYMPAKAGVPTPKAVLGDIAGAPGKLPYSKEVYEYMRLLAKAMPNRVKVWSIGTTEEGREHIAVAIGSDALMAKYEQNRAKLAKLADPRTIQMNDEEAAQIASTAAPVYYITGTIHSTEAGAPTALMELAYRLAVDDAPYVKNIRDHVITLITPIVEVDGRDRTVDLYNWKKAHPGRGRARRHLLGPLRRARQQPRRDGDDAQAHAERPQRVRRLEGAGAARPARVGRLHVRQHRRRRPVQLVARPAADERVADDRLEQRAGDDALRHAGRLRARDV